MEENHEADYLWGIKNIGKKIGRKPRTTQYLLVMGRIPGRKIGDLWVAKASELDAALSGCEE
jgi:hypothetical protein